MRGHFKMQKRIIITADDIERLEQLLDATSHRFDHAELAALGRELDRAEIVAADELSTNIVTMNSRVRLHDLDRDMEFVCSIVFPAEANADEMKISVLSPLGTALLGYAVGHVVCFSAPGGPRRVEIKALEYQPEAANRE